MVIKVKRTTRDVAGWRKLSSAQRAKLEQEYLNTPEDREFSKRNHLRAGNKVAWQYKLDEAVNRYLGDAGIGNLPARDIDGNVPMPPMVRPTIPYLGGGIPNMREALSYYLEDYNPLVHRFDDLMFR